MSLSGPIIDATKAFTINNDIYYPAKKISMQIIDASCVAG